jgi:O-acetyl-ADP-ribose deacetylase (regulator of RNase III)
MEVEAVVNAANNQLARGGGVCGAIFAAAGPKRLTRACDRIGFCPTGGAVLTAGFDLKARCVVHTVGPVWRGGESGEPEELRSCYRSSLRLAADNGLKSIAFPLLSSGIFGYPRVLALSEAIDSIRGFLAERVEAGEEPLRVFLVFFGEVSDLADPDDPPEPDEIEPADSFSDLAGEITAARVAAKVDRLALKANLEPTRALELARGAGPPLARSEVLALATALGWRPGRTRAALAELGRPPEAESGPDWPIVARHLARGGPDIHRINRSLFTSGLPILP